MTRQEAAQEQIELLVKQNRKLAAKRSTKPAVQEQIRRNCEMLERIVRLAEDTDHEWVKERSAALRLV